MTSKEIRQSFLDFFASKQHTVMPSSSLLPDAPNLLFTNAGMNQFVPIFLGQTTCPYKPGRAADTQKCIRAGGKHNDLEDVGLDTYHHTFFEMLGNWSFVDYFKREAIDWAWELLTERWKFPKERLYATYFGGDEKVPGDNEVRDLWLRYLPADHVVPGDRKDNFWMMGDTGPCGPCSEIHMDLTPAGDTKGGLVNAGDAQCIEIWNLVFIQFNANADGSLSPLPAKHVDTGMGFERVSGMMQCTDGFKDFSRTISNYESDVFAPIFRELERLSGKKYGSSLQDSGDIAFRVIADHIRCLSFAIADGILPSNEGRGYVLRRILRRAIRYGRNLGFREPFFYKLVEAIVANFAEVFPEVRINRRRIQDTLKAEEESFNRTLDRGIDRFYQSLQDTLGTTLMFAAVPAKVQTVVRYKESAITGGGVGSGPRFEIDVEKDYPGDVFGRLGIPLPPFPAKSAFELYDTFGFPLDLTELMARERGLTVDVAGFEKLMEEQRRRAREDHAKKKSVITVAGEGLQVEPTKFLGYDNLEAEVVVEAVQPGVAGSFEIIVDQTPFYAEMGGQVGDTGLVHVPGHDRDEIGRLTVLDTQKQGDVHVHKCKLLPYPESGGATVPVAGETAASQRLAPPKVWRAPEIGEAVRVAVDAGRRANIQRHHTVTHLFHWALHEVVSKDARQRGSLVAPDRLRFDFNHPERLTEQQIADIERLVNARVHENAPVFWFELPYHEVKDNPKIMQFFGDKYGNIVRIVQIGGHLDGLDGFSMELCGGTHTRTTGEIGLFKIAKESAISAGVRRIEAACGQFALEFIERTKSAAQAEAEREKARELEKVLQRQLKAETVKRAAVLAELALAKTQEHAGIPMIVDDLGEANAGFLRVVADALKPHVTSGVVVLGGVRDDKVSLLCYVTPDLVKAGHHAGKIVGELAKICGGGGGGKPDLAQAGGKQPDRLPEALAAARRLITG